MIVLGINDGYNGSAAIVVDGCLIAAVQQERLSRIKNQQGFPNLAINEVLNIAGLKLSDIDHFVFAGKQIDKFVSGTELILDYHQTGLFGKAFAECENYSRTDYLIKQDVNPDKIQYIEHHNCHLASAYLGFDHKNEKIAVISSSVISSDICSAAAVAQNGIIQPLQLINADYSAGLVYSIITMLMGFIPLQEEFKIMGLAPYSADSSAANQICQKLLSFFEFDDNLGFATVDKIPVSCFCENFKEIISMHRFDDIAGGVQLFTEQFFCRWIAGVLDKLKISKLALAGSVFMNVKLNKAIMELKQVGQLFVFPSCSEESNSIGAAFSFCNSIGQKVQPLKNLLLGKDITDNDAKQAIDNFNFSAKINIEYCDDIENSIAKLLADGKIVARCKGKSEFGARALGNRSILAPADNPQAGYIINSMIKIRDFWMPFAPSVLADDIDEIAVNKSDILPEYMIMAFDTNKNSVNNISGAVHPADKTTRPQAVTQKANPDYHRLLKIYKNLTGKSVILNTSCNLHGLPMVYSAKDCLEVFYQSGLEYMALANCLISKV